MQRSATRIVQVSTSVAVGPSDDVAARTVAVGDDGRAYLLEGERSNHPHWVQLPELPGKVTELCGAPGPRDVPCTLVRVHGGKHSWERRQS